MVRGTSISSRVVVTIQFFMRQFPWGTSTCQSLGQMRTSTGQSSRSRQSYRIRRRRISACRPARPHRVQDRQQLPHSPSTKLITASLRNHSGSSTARISLRSNMHNTRRARSRCPMLMPEVPQVLSDRRGLFWDLRATMTPPLG